MDDTFAFWKRMLLIVIGVVAAAGVLFILYFLYEAYALGKKGTVPAASQPSVSAERQEIVNSLTAPAQVSASSSPAAAPSGEQPHYAPADAPEPPSALTAPAPSPETSAQSQEDKAVIDSLTAPH